MRSYWFGQEHCPSHARSRTRFPVPTWKASEGIQRVKKGRNLQESTPVAGIRSRCLSQWWEDLHQIRRRHREGISRSGAQEIRLALSSLCHPPPQGGRWEYCAQWVQQSCPRWRRGAQRDSGRPVHRAGNLTAPVSRHLGEATTGFPYLPFGA